MHRIWLPIALLTAAAPAHADDDPCAELESKVHVRGTLVGLTTHELLVGATIVVSHPIRGEQVAISDEQGAYDVMVEPGTYDVTIYYADKHVMIASQLVVASDVRFAPTVIDDNYESTGCVLGGPPPPLVTTPAFGIRLDRKLAPISRDRTHRAWIAPVAAADSRTAITTIESGVRLQSAPGVPLAFVESMETYTFKAPVDLAMGSGGTTAIALRSGHNDPSGDARLVFGLDREAGGTAPSGGAEIFAAGPLVRDKAWLATGLVAYRERNDTLGSSGMLRFDYAKSYAHQLSIAGLAQSQDGVRDGWTNAQWKSRLMDGRVEIHAIATAEQLELPVLAAARSVAPAADASVINRAGGELAITWRKKALGYHSIAASARAGMGYVDRDRHDDRTLSLGDEWQIRPNIELRAGVRADTREFAGERTSLASPRVTVIYDRTKEGRSELFVAYQRISHLDDARPGAWRTLGTRYHDELATGLSYHRDWRYPVVVGIAGRARWPEGSEHAELGGDAWARYEGERTVLHASGTTFGRVGTVLGQTTLLDRRKNQLRFGVTTRASPSFGEGGGAVTWKHTGSHASNSRELDLDLSLEVYDNSITGPGSRLLLGGSW